MKEVRIANLSASMKEMTAPRFSPEGKTIYFVGVHVVDPPEGADASPYDVRAIYSVPTEGGEATRIPIDRVNSDGIPIHIGTFALSHDWSKFAINGGDGIFTVTLGGGAPTRVNKDSWYWSTVQQSIPQPPPDSHRWDRPCVGQPGWGGRVRRLLRQKHEELTHSGQAVLHLEWLCLGCRGTGPQGAGKPS
jgi:hypothetical protein